METYKYCTILTQLYNEAFNLNTIQLYVFAVRLLLSLIGNGKVEFTALVEHVKHSTLIQYI